MSLTAVLAACGGSGEPTESTTPDQTNDRFDFVATAMIENLTDEVIVAGYADLEEKADELYQATLTLNDSGATQADLAAAQNAWKAVRKPWEQGESHIFGPVDALSIDPHVDTWPLNTADLQALLAASNTFSANEVRNFTEDLQGFHAMEFLLFGDGVEDNTKAIAEMTDAEKSYLVALAEVFHNYTVELHEAWTSGLTDSDGSVPYAQRITNPESSGSYDSDLSVVEELVNGLIGIIDEVGNGKIAEPYGNSIATADTSVVESQYSWNSLTDFANNIKGVQNVWEGQLGDADGEGLVDFVNAANPELAERISAEIDTAIRNIQDIDGGEDMPFRQAILDTDGRARIQKAIDSLLILQTSLESDVLPLLNEWNI